MAQEKGWGKYFSTEFVSFSLVFSVSTVALFVGKADFPWWLAGALGSAVVCGSVRTVKNLKILGLEFEGFRAEREAGEASNNESLSP